MTSLALDVFDRLMDQVEGIRDVAARAGESGHLDVVPSLLRSAYVLTVAAFDTYMHEQGVRILAECASKERAEAIRVAEYLSRKVEQVEGASGESHVRLALTYKTLVAPESIGKLLTAAGVDDTDLWLRAAFAIGTRPDRLRLQLQLIYDRRNQIAHEGDWDFVQLDFRAMELAHLTDCIDHVKGLVRAIDEEL